MGGSTSRIAALALGSAFAAWALAVSALAQPSEAELEAALHADPTDVGAACSLGWLRVGQERWREAIERLEPAVQRALGQSGGRSIRRLGACLYNLGRAYEGADQRRRAIEAYRLSLSVRDNAAVRSRLRSLVPDDATRTWRAAVRREHARARAAVSEACARAARAAGLASEEECGFEALAPERYAPRGCGAGGAFWRVSVGPGHDPWIAFTPTRGATTAWRVQVAGAGTGHGNLEAMTLEELEVRRLDADRCGLVGTSRLETSRSDGEAQADVVYEGLYVSWVGGGGPRVAVVTTYRLEVADPEYRVSARLDGRGHVVVERVSGRPPASALGTRSLEDIALAPP